MRLHKVLMVLSLKDNSVDEDNIAYYNRTMALLGVNIDHIATVRQARGTDYPQPLQAALAAEEAGADGITVHLREDRRHILDQDVIVIKKQIKTRLNLEMALTDEMLEFAYSIGPDYVCLVPEKRRELTTEGGLDLKGSDNLVDKIKLANKQLAGVKVSLFIDPDKEQIDAAKASDSPIIELHTGSYAAATKDKDVQDRLRQLFAAAEYAASLGLQVNAGHGLHYQNVQSIVKMPHLHELNIGHSIIARALFVGIKQAVSEMKALVSSP